MSYELIDDVGAVYCLQAIDLDQSVDVDADLLERVVLFDEGLAESEELLFDGDPLTYSFRHTTKAKVIRRMLIRAMKDENPKAILRLKPVVDWVRATYTGAQIASYLNITINQAQKLAARFDALVAVQATLDGDTAEDFE